jgi:hypothetical protein
MLLPLLVFSPALGCLLARRSLCRAASRMLRPLQRPTDSDAEGVNCRLSSDHLSEAAVLQGFETQD